SIRDRGPSGNQRANCALSAPAFLPALASTRSVKPSKGASFRAAFSTACFIASSEAEFSALVAAFFFLVAGLSVIDQAVANWRISDSKISLERSLMRAG